MLVRGGGFTHRLLLEGPSTGASCAGVEGAESLDGVLGGDELRQAAVVRGAVEVGAHKLRGAHLR